MEVKDIRAVKIPDLALIESIINQYPLLSNDLIEPPPNICGHEFTWEDPVIPSGDPETVDGKITGVSFGETTVKDHTCIRQTFRNQEKCFWHSEVRPPKDIDELLSQESEEVICEAKLKDLTGISLSGMYLLHSKFSGVLKECDFQNSVLVFSQFENCDLVDVDFTGSNLQEVTFTGTSIRTGRKQLGGIFSSCKCEGSVFAEVTLDGVDFSKASFNQTTIFDPARTVSPVSFESADLSDADLSDISLSDSFFTNANLRGTDFSEARLSGSKFGGAMCLGTNFEKTELENVDFTGANLEGAMFKDAEFHSAVFTDAQIDYNTHIDNISIYERAEEADDKFEDRETRVLKALWTYRVLQKLCQENALLGRTRKFYLQEKDLRRKQYYREWTKPPEENILIGYEGGPNWRYRLKVLSQIIKAEGSRRTIKYGEGPWQVIKASFVVVLLFAVVYPIFGLEQDRGTIQYFFLSSSGFELEKQPDLMIETLLFSISTFTRSGVSQLSPIGASEVFAASESILGAVFVALLVFVLGRRTTY